jgi:hypothetical protein
VDPLVEVQRTDLPVHQPGAEVHILAAILRVLALDRGDHQFKCQSMNQQEPTVHITNK